MTKTIGVVLAGAGHVDGSEIHEATLTLLRLGELGVRTRIFAPLVRFAVADHVRRQVSGEERDAFVEAARIARGELKPLSEARIEELDGLIVPGGQGAGKILSGWLSKGAQAEVEPNLAALVRGMHAARKPQGFICLAPVIAALVLGREGVRVTIGNDARTAGLIELLGARHEERRVEEICADFAALIVTTPAYMLGPGIADINKGIRALVDQVVEWA